MATLINQDGTNSSDVLIYDQGGDGVVYHTMAGSDKVTIEGSSIALVNDSGAATITITGGSGHSITGTGTSVEKITINGANCVSAHLDSGRDEITLSNTDGRNSTGVQSQIRGGAWTDTFTTNEGTQRYQLYGDEGNDIFNIIKGSNITCWGGAAADTFNVTGGTGIRLRGGDSADVYNLTYKANAVDMQLGYGNDLVKVYAGDKHTIKANLGVNEIYLKAGSGHVITSDIDQAASKKAGKDVGYGVDKVYIDGATQVAANLGDGRDVVELKSGSNHAIYTEGWADTVTISGTVADSLIDTGAGDDIVTIESGNNITLVVGAGNDTITVNGGSVNELNGEAGTNTIIVTGGEVGAVTGGFVVGGNTKENTITITGGTFKGDIIGSTNNQGGSADSNLVTITGGSGAVNEVGEAQISVYGGRTKVATTNYNKVTVTSGAFVEVVGGSQYTKDGGVSVGNQVALGGNAVVDQVIGGSSYGNVSDNIVAVEGQAQLGLVVGGSSYGADASQNKVSVQGEAKVEKVIGGSLDAQNKSAEANEVKIGGKATVGTVIGANIVDTTVSGARANINNIVLSDTAVVEGNVYGVYSEQSNNFITHNKVTLTDEAEVKDSVYGAYSSLSAVSDNEIIVSGGSVTNYQWVDQEHGLGSGGAVVGGWTVDQNSLSNKVTMTGGEVTILRGARATGKGAASYNRVNMSGGTAVAVDGGYSNDGEAKDNWVYVTGGTVVSNIEGFAARIVGGRTKTGEAGYNNVNVNGIKQKELTVTGGQVDIVFDPETKPGLVRGNVVTMADSEAKRVVGGCNHNTGEVYDNIVSLTNCKVSAELTTADYTKISYVFENAVVGSYGYGSNIHGSRVNIKGGQLSAVYGAYNNSMVGSATDNIIMLEEGVTINYSVYGALTRYGDVTENKVFVRNAIVTGFDENVAGGDGGIVVGGYTTGGVAKKNEITMTAGEVHLLRGGRSEYGNVEENLVTVSGGTIERVEGGRSSYAEAINNRVVISGGTVSEVVRGGHVINALETSEIFASADRNIVEISGATVKDVYGGFATTSGDACVNKVTIGNTKVLGSVWGGYTPEGLATGNSVTINDKTTIEGDVYSGIGTENEFEDNNGTISVSGNATVVKGSILGGIGRDYITVSGSTVGGIESGRGNDTINIYGAKVDTVDSGLANDTIGVYGSTVDSIDGGAGNDTITVNSSVVRTVNGGTGNDTFEIYKSGSMTLTIIGGEGNDTYKFTGLAASENYIIDDSNISTDDNETFDLSAYNSEDFTIIESTANKDRIYFYKEGAMITIKNFKGISNGAILFKDTAEIWKTVELTSNEALAAAELDFAAGSVAAFTELPAMEESKLQIFGK